MVSERRFIEVGRAEDVRHRAREVPVTLASQSLKLSVPIGILIAFGLPY